MQLDYNVIYSSRRKTLSITVERDRTVVVKAPTGTPPETIQKVVESRKQWIYEKIHHEQKYRPPLHPPGKELVNGESLLYLGCSYRLELVDSVDDIALIENRFLVPTHQTQKRGAVFRQWYIQQANEIILPRVQHYAERLGVSFNEAKITDSKYRWGSCTTTDNVTLNWRLIKAPMFVIDYVVVHELAHFLEPNHTPRFWGIIRSQITNMEKAKHWLKVHGEMLEQTL
ncbi:M48 family metallopeptidase [Planktothrix mougeotii]|uniref:M48 family metallopeptidase n=1 Tax=Planktothrix mougeotii LEGE 06226 TaxID=1828728 RepID=A0ABR9UCA6_9CYAN|nr:SprT family zinc-dependent metalloprotease [Planktothrix mougeotii]MBE9144096.1 M48 family metallopeptidase [Planktothrix mougeotii LEGE 06226]